MADGLELVASLRQQVRELKKVSGLSGLRREFELKKKEEWEEIKANHDESEANLLILGTEQLLAQTVAKLYHAGVSKKDLCAAYGTKDYATINNLIDTALPEVLETSLTLEVDADLSKELGHTIWAVQVQNYGGVTGTVRVYSGFDGHPEIVPGTLDESLERTKVHQEIVGNETGEFTAKWAELA